jgi:hypothetical protein
MILILGRGYDSGPASGPGGRGSTVPVGFLPWVAGTLCRWSWGLRQGSDPGCTASKLMAWVSDLGFIRSATLLVVLVDRTAEHFASLDWQVQRWADLAVLVGWSLLPGLVRAVPVVMGGVLAED